MLKSDASSISVTSATPGAARATEDSLSHLHKMSRTAGLGSDYVAVNGVAIAALLFGLASAAIVFNTIFLLLPVVAIVLAIVAIRQIRNSNGTQTGTALAAIGLIAALGCGAFLGGKRMMGAVAERRDGELIAGVVQSFGADISARNYGSAYAKTSDTFRARITKDQFTTLFNQLQDGPYYGKVKNMVWNELVRFDVDNATLEPVAQTNALVTLENARALNAREPMIFRKKSGSWLIEDMPNLFPKEVKLVGAPRQMQDRAQPPTPDEQR